MALALYRKYRPRTFAEVIGQEHVTEPLIAALRGGRLNHAYLFSGPRGCGKTSSARILARSLNCERGPTPEPCGECDSCLALAPDGPGSIDVIEIDAASHGGVDDARDLRERAIFAPVSSRFKVYVIDEAHMVSSAGFNALLKLVEEPPDYVKFVFATTEPEKVLGTIKSRTHHYPFRLIPPGVLRPYLEKLCDAEGVKVEPAVFPLVVRAGGGSARDSLSVLDQLIAGAGPDGVSYAGAVALLGVTDVALIDEMCDALAAGDGAAVYAIIDRVAEAGHDPRRFASDLLERLRDLIVMQQVPEAGAKGLIDAPDDELTRMAAQAERFGPATLSRMADIVHTGLTEMRGTTAPRLLLELISARMLLPGADDSTGALLQRLERMERRLTVTGDAPAGPVVAVPVAVAPAEAAPAGVAPSPVAPSPVAVAPARAASPVVPEPADRPVPAAPEPSPPASTSPVSAPRASAPPEPAGAPPAAEAGRAQGAGPATRSGPGVVDAAAVRRVWDEVLVLVGRKSKKVAAWAREATVRDVDGDTLVLVFKHGFHATALAADPALVIEAVYEVLGGRWQLRCEVAGHGAGAAAGPAAAPNRTQPAGPAPAGQPAGAVAAGPPARQQAPAPRQSSGRSSGAPPAGRSSAGTAPAGEPDPEPEPDWPEIARPGGAPETRAGEAGPAPGAATGLAATGYEPGGYEPGGYDATPPGAGAGWGAGAATDPGVAGDPRLAARAAAAGRSNGSNGMAPAAHPGEGAAGPGATSPAAGAAHQGAGSAGLANAGAVNSGAVNSGMGNPGARNPGIGNPAIGNSGAGSQGTGNRAAAGPGATVSGIGSRGADRGTGGRGAGSSGAAGNRGAAGRPGGAGRPGAGGRNLPADSGWDAAQDEPPYDPDYDPPVRDVLHEGFDPGDEPLDEIIDERTARQTSEQQALQLLQQTLGAEKIGEVGPV